MITNMPFGQNYKRVLYLPRIFLSEPNFRITRNATTATAIGNRIETMETEMIIVCLLASEKMVIITTDTMLLLSDFAFMIYLAIKFKIINTNLHLR